MIAHHVAESAFGKDSGALGAAPDKLLSDLILPWILAPTDLKDRFFVGVVTVLKLVSLRSVLRFLKLVALSRMPITSVKRVSR